MSTIEPNSLLPIFSFFNTEKISIRFGIKENNSIIFSNSYEFILPK